MKHAARRRTRTLAAAGALVLLGSLTACGDDGGDDAPESASREDFCSAIENMFMGGMDVEEGDTEAQIKAIKDAADELADVGTPEDMPDDARRGFELFIDLANDVEEGMSEDELNDLGGDLSDEDDADFEAFTEYATTTCAEELGMPTDMPSDLEDLESPSE